MTENIYSQRLLLFIEKKGWSKSALGRVLDIKRQNIGRYFTGEADPRKIVINLIPHGLNLDWFLTGEGEMYVKKEGPTGAEGEKKGSNQHNAEGDRAQNNTTPVQHPQNDRLTPAQQPLNANAKTRATPAQPPPYSPATPAQQIANANNDAPAPAPPYSRLTPAQQALRANASSIAIKTHPFLYEAIGYRLAVHELDIIEGDILVIDPTLTAESGDIILRSSPEGPELAKYQPGEKNTKGIVVGLTRQYPAIHRQPSQEPPAG